MIITARFQAQIAFFDRRVIKSNWKAINDGPLKRAGLLVRKIARQSIGRRVKRAAPRPPGMPPRSRTVGEPFKLIYSIPQHFDTSVIVGMVGFNHQAVPGLHEHGGTVRRRVFVPIPYRNKAGAWRIKNKAVVRPVRIPPRPFMYPALVKARTLLPPLWANSIYRSTGRRAA